MKITRRILTTRFLVPFFTFSVGCFLTNVFTNISCLGDRKPIDAEKTECFLLILILSAPGNVDRRNAIRETWLNLRPHHNGSQRIYIPTYDESGWLIQESIEEQVNSLGMYKQWLHARQFIDQSKPVKVIHKFAIGTAGLTRTRQNELFSESSTHDDLLLVNGFQDSYKNLTKKLVLSLKSLSDSHSFHYLLKCDDDTYVKLDNMISYLKDYHDRIASVDFGPNPMPELYWGYFNGKANIKTQGHWKETHFNLCSKYLPYALGGGYIISEKLVQYVQTNANILSLYTSEDISVGIWFASMRNVFRKHDCRFDTAYMARSCKNYHMVLHKRSAEDMRKIFKGNECDDELNEIGVKRPLEYFYNWKAAPMQCCDTIIN
ncbi:beta-1,3-galactosyltransferase 6 isoform X1 [Bradysia coprophila]|uniref:beta-1,3-galactosyltransferase 6 isoform X1 n=1 Tax=Bradysia coprophila TaxID=38358 RepID=UPI00187D75A1|nr:beta-1,3-galactosyltransferase 6 isoform X1 [Bradysia coprophila]